ncbi:methionine aminopeptidase [Candidatus Arthromitus sp. SFB-mouse-Japan]|mgnify:CR=1 FL=1|uniref:type I methionyl aminopeptidase n=1 Tax=unclassified Candidatus Neoarthromitus TaxID=2638829 RepID=UPI00021B813B|nr:MULTISPECIES: type I methionyl aminopeptidase [unclassified Candidatus Arthromitus]EIA24229.1 Methionine aminopeptidase [Candidatus Arthromitus sp. SFB-1]EIA27633.1 Methionine aminopeptidase [Candidatus Arthromitus sp. SFB-4]EIA28862.1 Methionine aminopeptidase [Candidatus Arthromitus sp. SFB-co]EIA30152.1 Methionine aminopeptidase [Candidatus Arthromitus sp. SFB-mouse-SU]AID45345.1 Methionine aminopeptidase [Candidatus Arthromitus sp. SFB-mouse-NL]
MIYIKNDEEISLMKKAGKIVGDTLKIVESIIKEGVTTNYLDSKAEDYIIRSKAKPSFKGYYGFPSTLCVSINNQVIHGIPSDRIIKEGDIVSVDCGANIYGFHADAARTFAIGNVSSEAKNLIETTCDSFFKSLKYAREGYFIGDISSFIQEYVENKGYSIVKDFTGHGIGRSLHEAPEIPNFGKKGTGFHIKRGMAIAIEPMVNLGKEHVKILDDNWTVVTIDNSLSAHYENTVIITDGDPEIITL